MRLRSPSSLLFVLGLALCTLSLSGVVNSKSCKDLERSKNLGEHCCPRDQVRQVDGVTLMCSDLEITSDDVPKCNPEGGERASREQVSSLLII